MTGRDEMDVIGNGDGMSYDDSKTLARDHHSATRRKLAARKDVRPEILYYLATDELVEVRREVPPTARHHARRTAFWSMTWTKRSVASWRARSADWRPVSARRERTSSIS